MVDVLLLHGAWCGSWTWRPLIQEFKALGVDAVAADLPIERADADVDAYVDVALDSLGPGDRPLVVGHSLAGILLEPLAARRPVAGLVYLNAFVPDPGHSLRECWRRDPAMFVEGWNRGLERTADDTSAWVDTDGAVATLFGRCHRARAEAAAALLRPQSWHLVDSVFDGSLETPSRCVLGDADRLLDVHRLTRDAAARLGVSAETIDADHCPMFSRPAELAGRLMNP
jgi:pimeloyl-ACP methyl ester carboxylesterase